MNNRNFLETALIGYTGFVGSHLSRQQEFTAYYNSRNIEEIKHKTYQTIICAGVPAVKWLANKEPQADLDNINYLWDCLKTVTVDKLILISTVDVYPNPQEVNELTAIDEHACQPYGRHRLLLERRVSQQFNSLIIRLPGLFGQGLKKNIIYDFLNHNNLKQINSLSAFQFYNLDCLSRDIEIALQNNLNIINISSEPTTVKEIAEICLRNSFINELPHPVYYNFKSQYAELFHGMDGYLYQKTDILRDLKQFVYDHQRGAA